MDNWNDVNTQKDIDFLMSTYGSFHDAVIVSANYQNGYYVDDEMTLYGCGSEEHTLSVIFHCQWKPRVIELRFTGLRQIHLVGWQDNYLPIISDAYLSFQDKLLPGNPQKVVVWADNDWFDVNKINNTIHEPADTYIVANALRWRIIKD